MRRSSRPALDPDADPAFPDFTRHTECAQRSDDPDLQRSDEGAHIAATMGQVQHHIGYALPRTMIGQLTASAALEDRKPISFQ